DQDVTTGPLGYDWATNLEVLSSTETTLKAWRNEQWEATATLQYRVNGNGMEIAVPRALMTQEISPPRFDFHWVDNIEDFSQATSLGLHGDSAPNRRSNYRYESAVE